MAARSLGPVLLLVAGANVLKATPGGWSVLNPFLVKCIVLKFSNLENLLRLLLLLLKQRL